jgi:hypothetical protein
MLYVREAHPGENMPAHQDREQKRAQAEHFKGDTGTAWTVVVDGLDGSVHKLYGLLPNSIFLIDAEGRVSFIGDISHGPTLPKALDRLFEQSMRGIVPEGDDKMLHMLGPTAYGWEAIRRGGQVSMHDVSMRMPPLAMNLWLGNKIKSLLDPRCKPFETDRAPHEGSRRCRSDGCRGNHCIRTVSGPPGRPGPTAMRFAWFGLCHANRNCPLARSRLVEQDMACANFPTKLRLLKSQRVRR